MWVWDTPRLFPCPFHQCEWWYWCEVGFGVFGSQGFNGSKVCDEQLAISHRGIAKNIVLQRFWTTHSRAWIQMDTLSPATCCVEPCNCWPNPTRVLRMVFVILWICWRTPTNARGWAKYFWSHPKASLRFCGWCQQGEHCLVFRCKQSSCPSVHWAWWQNCSTSNAQLCLIRKNLALRIPGYWSTLVRLGHLFESYSFRKKFYVAIAKLIKDNFDYMKVVELPAAAGDWRRDKITRLRLFSDTGGPSTITRLTRHDAPSGLLSKRLKAIHLCACERQWWCQWATICALVCCGNLLPTWGWRSSVVWLTHTLIFLHSCRFHFCTDGSTPQ